MYVASALAVAVVGFVYTPLAARWRRDRVAAASALGFAVLFCVAFVAERLGMPGIYVALYIYVEVLGSLVLLQFWTLMNELYHAREARRLYGIVGTGGTVANIVIGVATSALATRLGAPSVLILCACLCVGAALSAVFAGHVGKERLFAKAATARFHPLQFAQGASRVWESPHLRAIALLSAVTFFTTTLVDFEFKVMAGNVFAQDQLAAYFGRFSAWVGVLALGLQLLGTGPLLNRVGVVAALAVLPTSLAMGNIGLGLLGFLGAAAAAKGADSLFRYTVNDASTQLLYLPVPPQARAASKAFIDGVVKSGAIGLAGVFLLGYRRVFGASVVELAWVAVGLCALWGAAVAGIRTQYVRSLQANLRNRRLDAVGASYDVPEASTGKLLLRALESSDPREVRSALELLPQMSHLQPDEKVEPLLGHPDVGLRIAALSYFTHRQSVRYATAVFRRVQDPEPAVRAAALEAFCNLGRDKSVRSIRQYVKDPDPAVRSAALVGMIRYGGLDGVLSAAEALKEMISHENSTLRMHAAKVLGAIGVRNFYQPVLELMNDPDPTVRREAIRAAGQLRSPEFVIPLIYKTQSPHTGVDAVEALSAYGEGIALTLGKVLANVLEELPVRRSVARVLGRIGTREAVHLLVPHLDSPDEELRLRLDRALTRVAHRNRLPSVERKAVEAALELELLRVFRVLAACERLGLAELLPLQVPHEAAKAAGVLLASALADKIRRAEQRVFLLLAVLYPDAGMEHIYEGIRDASEGDARRRRANAVELLDNLLERRMRKRLLPLVEDMPRSEKLRLAAQVLTLPTAAEGDLLNELCRDENAWVRACSLHYAAEVNHPEAAEAVFAASADPDPVVRETALVVALRTRPEQAVALAEMRLADESAVVRRQANRIAAGPSPA